MTYINKKLGSTFDGAARPVLAVDVEKYQSWLDDSGLSEAQKKEFLQAVWSMVVTFVELGFGVHPLQEVCGKDGQSVVTTLGDDFDKVKSETSNKSPPQGDSSP